MKDIECKAYIHTDKCDSKSCEGCQYRHITNDEAIEKLNEIREIISKRDNAFDNQEFGASYSDLDNIIDEIREIIRN